VSERAGVRLQKVLAAAGVASRRKAEELIAAGHVKVNGRVVRELGTRVDPTRDRVSVRGEPIAAEEPVTILLHKPDGVVSSTDGPTDDRGRPTVVSLLRGVPQRVFPVGRLDYHTRGVLLLTNDGVLAAALAHPRHRVPKTYHAKFQGHVDARALAALAQGVELEDGIVTEPALEVLAFRRTAANTWVQLTIAQGLHRQVRRMGDAIGHPVLKLIRVAIGDLTTDKLPEGEFRRLREVEVEQLRALVSPAAAQKPRKRRKGA
jgi:pseudouridine synthase